MSAGAITTSTSLNLAQVETRVRDSLPSVFLDCRHRLYRFVLARVSGNTDEAAELVQQVCFEAARKGGAPAAATDCEAWLFGIAKKLIAKHFRGKRRSRNLLQNLAERGHALGDDARDFSGSPQTVRFDTQSVLQALSCLPDTDRALLIGVYFDGRSHGELAEEIGISPRAVEGRLRRARQALRQFLTKEGSHD